MTIAAGLKSGQYKVDPADLPGGDKARFRVVVTDGVLTGSAKTKPFAVAAKAPRISIATPVEGAVFNEGQSVQLVASVVDDQDAAARRRGDLELRRSGRARPRRRAGDDASARRAQAHRDRDEQPRDDLERNGQRHRRGDAGDGGRSAVP